MIREANIDGGILQEWTYDACCNFPCLKRCGGSVFLKVH